MRAPESTPDRARRIVNLLLIGYSGALVVILIISAVFSELHGAWRAIMCATGIAIK